MEHNLIVKVLYSLFLGLLLAVFLGVGISTFYPSPKQPKWPNELNTGGKAYTSAQVKIQQDYDRKMDKYNEKMKPYNRNVSIATLIGAIVYAAISLVFEKKTKVIADGIMIGGVFSLIYGLGRGFASGDDKYSFIAVTIGLVIVLFLGYHRLDRPHNNAKASN